MGQLSGWLTVAALILCAVAVVLEKRAAFLACLTAFIVFGLCIWLTSGVTP